MSEKVATTVGLLLLVIVLGVVIFADVAVVTGIFAFACAGAVAFGLVVLARRRRSG